MVFKMPHFLHSAYNKNHDSIVPQTKVFVGWDVGVLEFVLLMWRVQPLHLGNIRLWSA